MSLKCDILVSKFALKWVNLYRYVMNYDGCFDGLLAFLEQDMVGLYKLNSSVDP